MLDVERKVFTFEVEILDPRQNGEEVIRLPLADAIRRLNIPRTSSFSLPASGWVSKKSSTDL